MSLTLTILGCGSSAGVPRVGGDWGQCDPENPKNRRRRCSVLLRRTTAAGETRVLIDTSPDLREQLLDAGVGTLDAAVFTHPHADHCHGIDELRVVAFNGHGKVQCYADRQTADMLGMRFHYIFETPEGSSYPPICDLHLIRNQQDFAIYGPGGSVELMPFEVGHGDIHALGFRIGDTAYTPDVKDIPDASIPALEGLDLWIIDALRRTRHPSHFSLSETLSWIARLQPKRAVITNMHVDLDYATLAAELPEGVVPGFDGMVLEIG